MKEKERRTGAEKCSSSWEGRKFSKDEIGVKKPDRRLGGRGVETVGGGKEKGIVWEVEG